MTTTPKVMHAMVLERPKAPLVLRVVPTSEPGEGQILIRVASCGVCRTDQHIADGELAEPKLPLILGHETVGRIVEVDDHVDGSAIGSAS